MHQLLATIGGSSKRDEIDLPRVGFLGRFGIGLMSCFVVADQIEVTSRSARGGAPIRFVGRHDGTYDVEVLAGDDPAAPTGPGTRVRLVPRPDARDWVAADAVERLARTYGEVLPVGIHVERPDGSTVDVVDHDPPWLGAVHGIGRGREVAQAAWCERRFGMEPLAVIWPSEGPMPSAAPATPWRPPTPCTSRRGSPARRTVRRRRWRATRRPSTPRAPPTTPSCWPRCAGAGPRLWRRPATPPRQPSSGTSPSRRRPEAEPRPPRGR